MPRAEYECSNCGAVSSKPHALGVCPACGSERVIVRHDEPEHDARGAHGEEFDTGANLDLSSLDIDNPQEG